MLVVFDRIRSRTRLKSWAHHEGLDVEDFFVKLHRGSFEEFDALVARLQQKRDEGRRPEPVVVLSLNDLSRCEPLQAHMRAQIEQASGHPIRIVHERSRDRTTTAPLPLFTDETTERKRPGRKQRYSCPWCQEPKRWPDRCVEKLRHTAEEDPCTSRIVAQCRRQDHRRCTTSTCALAARWHESVSRAAIAATRSTGTRWAVVSIIRDDDVDVIATGNDFKRARLIADQTFDYVYRMHFDTPKQPVYVVRGSDGSIF